MQTGQSSPEERGTTALGPEQQALLAESITVLGLSVRTINTLEDNDRGLVLSTVGDLLSCSREQLAAIPNVGEKTLSEIFAALAARGFHCYGRRPAMSREEALARRREQICRHVLGDFQ